MAEKKAVKRVNQKKREQMRKKRRRRKAMLFVLEVLVLVILGGIAYGIWKLDKLDFNVLNEENLEVYKENGDYTNIALFGLDSREGELDKGVRSDCIMIASIHNETNKVKIMSIYRDTLLQQQDGTYEKANAAYSYGGPEEAIALLNRNLDLDIRKYVSVNFNALVDVIDMLGGIEIDLTEEEMIWTRGYASDTGKLIGKTTEELTHAGLQKLDGLQAVGYARVRKTAGNDFKRTERQRIVLQKVVEKAQQADLATLNKIIDKVFPEISTNFSMNELVAVAANALKYEMGETAGFPFDVQTSEHVKNHIGSYVVPVGLTANVSQLHAFLFEKQGYEPSENVREADADIVYLTGIQPESAASEE